MPLFYTETTGFFMICLLCCAERVKVVVRVRPPRASETGGAIKVAPDHRGIVLSREYALFLSLSHVSPSR